MSSKTTKVEYKGVTIYRVPRRTGRVEFRVLLSGVFTTFETLRAAKKFVDTGSK